MTNGDIIYDRAFGIYWDGKIGPYSSLSDCIEVTAAPYSFSKSRIGKEVKLICPVGLLRSYEYG